jgi:stage V sporulation protein D (sporulation-specific penicillin-binding protein)
MAAPGKKIKVKKKLLNRMKIKLIVGCGVVLIGFIVVLCRLVYIETTKGEEYAETVLSQQRYDSISIPYRRGDILDRNGTALATSEKVYNLILEPAIIDQEGDKTFKDSDDVEHTYKEVTIDALKVYFGLTDEEIQEALSDTSSFYKVMKKKLTYEEIEPYNEYILTKTGAYVTGIWLEDEYQRTYPYDSLACQVLGFTASGNVGNSGLEKYYNEELNGVEGRQYGYLTSEQTLQRTTREPENGYSLVTTLDANIQMICEEEIAEFMEQTGAKNVSVLAMDPNNGEILALANSYTFDCNNPYDTSAIYYQFANGDGSYSYERTEVVEATTEEETGEEEETTAEGEEATTEEPQTVTTTLTAATGEELVAQLKDDEVLDALNNVWRNYVISDTFEPGSTFKPFTVAAGLEEDVIHDGDTYYCGGSYVVIEGEKAVGCHLRSGHGTITIEEAIMQSCNVALMQIVQAEGASTFYKYEKAFGFGSKTYVDLPGEANTSSLVYTEDGLNPMELATSSFGQGQNVSMIQLATAFCSLVNGGDYYEPHVVKQIVNEDGSVIVDNSETLLRRTVSEETSRLLREYMYQTVEEGTGKKARIEGYTIGGKTGTAEKQPRGNENYVISFIGFAPVEKPQIVLYVTVDEPNVEDQANSGVSSVIAHDIFERVLPYLNIFQSGTTVDDGSPAVDEIAVPVEVDPDSTTAAPSEGISTEEASEASTQEDTSVSTETPAE